MKITILNGDPKNSNGNFTKQLHYWCSSLESEHQIEIFDLKNMNLNYCQGCWSCWWKTPGLCAIKDEGGEIFKSVINSDFFLFASPLIAGFTSAELKKITDRLIVLVHPYVEMRNGESHHKKRYAHYPDFGLILEKEDDTDEEDIQINETIYDRLGINFHAEKIFCQVIDKDENWNFKPTFLFTKKQEETA